MPEDSKKNQQKKGKQDAKEQRKPKQGRKQQVEKNIDRVLTSKAPAEADQDLKLETDKLFSANVHIISNNNPEVINISEGLNSKYSKKEIKSNWSKYETPIETYEELDEQNVGADFEKLIQMPMTIGGHFQFKHEKSWDSSAAPSEYDKYFEINMENLAVALCTVPFYERNNIDTTTFTELDITTMNNRAAKYKQKYNNDKNCMTLKKSLGTDNICNDKQEINLTSNLITPEHSVIKLNPLKNETLLNTAQIEITVNDSATSKILNFNENTAKIITDDFVSRPAKTIQNLNDDTKRKGLHSPLEASKSVTECPEDLDKWLDDFLDK